GKRRLEMVNYKVNGMDQELGTIRTRMNFLLGRFEQPNISFRETRPGKKPTVKTAAVRNVIGDALNHIDRHCAAAKKCNDAFLGLGKLAPMSLRQILDGKTLYIYRLKPEEGFELTDLPAGFTEGWGPKHANIGLNELVLSDAMWTASVLLHELAHVAGAPGGEVEPKSIAAEAALNHCGLKEYYDPDALGATDRPLGRDHSQHRVV